MSDLVQAAQQSQKGTGLAEALEAQRDHLTGALSDRVGVDRFIRAAVTSFRTTPALAKCDPQTVMGGLFLAAQAGLEVGGPQPLASLVPYKDQATLIIEYRGFVQLFYRAGARKVEWFVVREGDTFEQWSSGTRGRDYRYVPMADNDTKRPLTGVVAQIVTRDGDVIFEYMSKAQIDARKKNTSFWRDWYEEMALKTVMRRLAKTVPWLSADIRVAMDADETVGRHVAGTTDVTVEHLPTEHAAIES